MFDYIMAECPKCGAELEFQTHGEDRLIRYSIYNVPAEYVAYVRPIQCKTCGKGWKLVLPPVTPLVKEVEPEEPEWSR